MRLVLSLLCNGARSMLGLEGRRRGGGGGGNM